MPFAPAPTSPSVVATRLRTAVWLAAGAVALTLLGERLVLPVLHPLQVGPRVVELVTHVTAGLLLGRWTSTRAASRIGVAVLAVVFTTNLVSGVASRDVVALAFVVLGSCMSTAVFLPWGGHMQLVIVALGLIASAVNAALVPGSPEARLHPALGMGVSCLVSIWVAFELDRRRREREQMAAVVTGQNVVLEMIAVGAPLPEILCAIARLVETNSDDLACSILLLEGDRLRPGATPSLPERCTRALDGVVIGPDAGSCGSAAFHRAPVVADDVATDPRCAAFRDVARECGVRACWSAPILSGDGSCLGTFVLHYREARTPATRDWRLIGIATHLAGVAIERARTQQALTESRQQLEEESRVATALVEVGREMMAVLHVPGTTALLERLCSLATSVLQCDAADVCVHAPEDDTYVIVAAHGFPDEDLEGLHALRLPAATVAPVLARLERRGVAHVDTVRLRHQDPVAAAIVERFGISRALYVPLRRGNETIGFLAANHRAPGHAFSRAQNRIAAGIGQLAALALEIARLVEQLERANRLKSEFVSTMSHELRTPLSIIMGFTEMLDDDLAPSDRTAMLGRIRSAGHELLELIESTLDLSRLEAGQDPPQLDTVLVPALLDELAMEFAALPRSPQVALAWEPPPGGTLWSDRRKLRIIIKNLVSNALKFTPAGAVTVRCVIADGRWRLVVADTGIGIPAKHLPAIFEMFRQVDSSDARSYSGVGLGLYITQRLVTQLGGEIAVESEPGRGTTFTVSLPMPDGATRLAAAS